MMADGRRDDRIPPGIRRHILDGDREKNSGGHRSGNNLPGKTEFPKKWTDSDVITAISQTLDYWYHREVRPNHINLYGYINGVRLEVRLMLDGTVKAAYPLDGEGVMRNDDREDTVKYPVPLGTVQHVPSPS
jgi:hypothetical protein